MDLALLFNFAYIVMIKIYVTIYLEREKRLKSLVLLVLWVKWVVSPPFMVYLGLVDMGVSLPSCSDPFG